MSGYSELTLSGAAILLLAIATAAAYLPAGRGIRMAPVDALRVN